MTLPAEDPHLLPPLPAPVDPEQAVYEALLADTRARVADLSALLARPGYTPSRALRLLSRYAELQRSMLEELAIEPDEEEPAEMGGAVLGMINQMPQAPGGRMRRQRRMAAPQGPYGGGGGGMAELLQAADTMFDKITKPQELTGLTQSYRNAVAAGDAVLAQKIRRKIDAALDGDGPTDAHQTVIEMAPPVGVTEAANETPWPGAHLPPSNTQETP